MLAHHSADGVHWTQTTEQPIITEGKFDSHNVAFYDNGRNRYVAFFRDFKDGVRGVKTATSPDFLHWTEPQWLDFGPDAFYEAHLKYVGGKRDVWYVPMGPLYAFRTIRDKTVVTPAGKAAYTVASGLDPKIYGGAVTLEFEAPPGIRALSNGRLLAERTSEPADRWNREYIRREGSKLYATVLSNTKLEFFTPGPAPDLSGSWKLSYQTPNGKMRVATLVLKVEGDRLTGTLASDRGNAPITEGHVNGSRLSLSIVRKGNGDEVPVGCEGTWRDGALYLALRFRGGDPVAATATR